MLDIADRREIFVDHTLIDSLDNTQLVMHRPQPQGLVFQFDKPWEGWGSSYVTMLHDGDQFRMYYRGGPSADHKGCFCLALSDDGIHWQRPNLGLVEFQGSKDNNILFMSDRWAGIAPFIDRKPGTPDEQRYKAVVMLGKDAGPGCLDLGAAVSADGINWESIVDGPVITKGAFDTHNLAFWSEAEGCYVSYYRVYSKSPDWRKFLGRRTIARATSDDFVNWSDPVMMDFGDTPTEQLYTNGTLPYFRAPHIYVSLASRYVLGRDTPLSKQQIEDLAIPEGQRFISDAVFMTSRGGNKYDRTFMEGFHRPGNEPGNWSSRTNMPAWGILDTSDSEMSLYFGNRYAQPGNSLLRTTLRKDGFSSINAGWNEGEFLTKRFVFSGDALELNMATSGVGSIKVEIQDENGKPFRDFGIGDSYDLYGDEISKIVKWQGSTDVSMLKGKPVRLRFVMKDCDLYSLRFK